jgi:hypothetical protein
MDDQACPHGYLKCLKCEEEANERARKVARFYEAAFQAHGKALDKIFGEPTFRFVARRTERDISERVVYQRCKCGSRLMAELAIETGICHYCRTGAPRPWTDRCKCGTGLMGVRSAQTGKCSDCRLDEELQ